MHPSFSKRRSWGWRLCPRPRSSVMKATATRQRRDIAVAEQIVGEPATGTGRGKYGQREGLGRREARKLRACSIPFPGPRRARRDFLQGRTSLGRGGRVWRGGKGWRRYERNAWVAECHCSHSKEHAILVIRLDIHLSKHHIVIVLGSAEQTSPRHSWGPARLGPQRDS